MIANFVHLEINTVKEMRFNMDMNASSSWEQICFGYNWNETNLLKFRHEKVRRRILITFASKNNNSSNDDLLLNSWNP